MERPSPAVTLAVTLNNAAYNLVVVLFLDLEVLISRTDLKH